MALQLLRASAEHIPDLARIMFDAFQIHAYHRFPLDIPSVEVAHHMMEACVLRPDFYGVTAVLDGKVVGGNFTQISDAVSGVGPIAVDPACQAGGIGRKLMQHVVDWSLEHHGPMVRLMQDAFNMRSISLYTSIGFTVVEPILLMAVPPAEQEDPTVRPLEVADLPQCDELCSRIFKVSRHNELAFNIEHGHTSGFIPFGRFKHGRLQAYVTLGLVGFGIGESADELLATAVQAARHVPEALRLLFVPSRYGDFLRKALKLKLRGVKPMSLMAIGPYQEPLPPGSGAVWTPSVAY